ncbi:hypothetical protein EII34_15710 [Arachnia propionica]|uniref:Uncharacterized protein n=1 Tax=Arachnia propionica TaxID=1750 RepID=A0A3P1T1D8_9ACTN|nr:hypothetical protein [Arachnia propionica]RRD02616.1 hypothetical protein EII34_15710 [Arachnia propionica]
MITLEVTSVDISSPGAIFTQLLLATLGFFALRVGLSIRNATVPHFVSAYNGQSSSTLGLPYGGLSLLIMGSVNLLQHLPAKLAAPIAATALLGMTTFLLSTFIWFPRFLLPRWYPRAVKAGVPRHDPLLMGAFKALPHTEQLELLHHTTTSAATPTLPTQPPEPPTAKTPHYHTPNPTTGHGNLPLGITSGLNQQPSSPNENQDPR